MVTFYLGNAGEYASIARRLPSSLADHLLVALGYESGIRVFLRELTCEDLRRRITALRRQFALGRGREFTSAEVDEPLLLREVSELERVMERAQKAGKTVLLVNG